MDEISTEYINSVKYQAKSELQKYTVCTKIRIDHFIRCHCFSDHRLTSESYITGIFENTCHTMYNIRSKIPKTLGQYKKECKEVLAPLYQCYVEYIGYYRTNEKVSIARLKNAKNQFMLQYLIADVYLKCLDAEITYQNNVIRYQTEFSKPKANK